MKKLGGLVFSILFLLFCTVITVKATTFTITSPTSKGQLPSGVTEIGGIVLDMVGSNGVRVVSELPASSLYQGFYSSSPGTIGTQTGFTSTILNALGGGISELAVRITLYDGDTSPGDFDYNDDTLLLNGLDFGNFSDVKTDITDSTGTTSFGQVYGFSDDKLCTGFFYSNDSTLLTNLYNSLLSTNKIVYELADIDPGDNWFDFTQGISASYVNIGQGPTITTVPEPCTVTMFLLGSGLLGLAGIGRKK